MNFPLLQSLRRQTDVEGWEDWPVSTSRSRIEILYRNEAYHLAELSSALNAPSLALNRYVQKLNHLKIFSGKTFAWKSSGGPPSPPSQQHPRVQPEESNTKIKAILQQLSNNSSIDSYSEAS